MSATNNDRQPNEPRPAEGTTPADAIDTSSPGAAGRDAAGIGKQLIKAFGRDGLTTQAAAVAYNFLFAVAPLLIFIMSLAATVSRTVNPNTDQTVTNVISWLTERLPATTAQALEPVVRGALTESGGGLISIGALLALFGARGAMGALIGALNVSYQVDETRSFIKRQLLAIGLTLGTGLGIILAIALFLVGDIAGNFVADQVGLGDAWALAWNILRFPIILIILVSALAALYWAAPNSDIPFRWLSPGAIFGVVGWVLITLFINLYFRYAGGYAESYGVLGGVLAFVFYLYLMSLVILVGGELNAILARRAPQEDGVERSADAQPAADADGRGNERVDDRVKDALRDVRRTFEGPRPAPVADAIPGRSQHDRGSAARGLAAGAGAALAGIIAVLLGRRG
ncbi:MAG TPA: YihY/virulence factor BrkB family protein [Thermomicrobiales bacterium]|jgi:membrane protein|nr:YihY/virulence factor BrkB family protein [Thermomicrobiales bacterium]